MSVTAGANFKTLLTRLILQTGNHIDKLDDFKQIKLTQPSLSTSRRSVLILNLDEMMKERKKVEISNKTVPYISGLKSFHQFIFKGNGEVYAKKLLYFCSKCLTGDNSQCDKGNNDFTKFHLLRQNIQIPQAPIVEKTCVSTVSSHGRPIKSFDKFVHYKH